MRKASPVLLCLGLVFGLASLAQAQATRTWVSGVGDDANPCSRTAPCKTFAGAISKTANGGFINVLDAGGFGAVSIVNKSITIDGEGSHAGVLASLTNGIIINGAGAKVTLRNLAIESPSVTNLGSIGINVISGRGGPHRELSGLAASAAMPSTSTRAAAGNSSSTTSRPSATSAAPSAWSTGARLGQPAQRLHERRRRVRARQRDRDRPRQHRRRRQCRVRGEHERRRRPQSRERTCRRTTPTGSWSPPARPCASAIR